MPAGCVAPRTRARSRLASAVAAAAAAAATLSALAPVERLRALVGALLVDGVAAKSTALDDLGISSAPGTTRVAAKKRPARGGDRFVLPPVASAGERWRGEKSVLDELSLSRLMPPLRCRTRGDERRLA